MEWHVNDLSLHGQFSNSEDAKAALEAILSLRSRRSDLSSRLFCSRSLGKRHLTPTQTLQEFAQSHPDRNFRSSLIRWIAGQGPFWSDDRAPVENDDDLFYLRTTEVTEQGLGEASRRMLLTIPAASFSVEGSDPELEKGLLTVVHGLLEQPLGLVEVPNCYGPSVLETNTPVDITSWQGMLNLAATKKYLLLSNSIALALKPKPFSPSLADRVLLLLDILSSLAEETDSTGGLTAKGIEIYEKHFVGKHAWFSDEAENKLFWFEDPSGGEKIYCSWHGKTKQGGQTRIHFQWPRPANQREIKIGYIGTKLTKW